MTLSHGSNNVLHFCQKLKNVFTMKEVHWSSERIWIEAGVEHNCLLFVYGRTTSCFNGIKTMRYLIDKNNGTLMKQRGQWPRVAWAGVLAHWKQNLIHQIKGELKYMYLEECHCSVQSTDCRFYNIIPVRLLVSAFHLMGPVHVNFHMITFWAKIVWFWLNLNCVTILLCVIYVVLMDNPE